MSRHRFTRGINLLAELEDYDADDYIDDASNELSPEDQQRMREGVAAVQTLLGDALPQVTNKEIEESLWHYYYDVQKTFDYIFKQYSKPVPPVAKKPAKKSAKKGSASDYLTSTTVDPLLWLNLSWGEIREERRGDLIPPAKLRGGLLGGASDHPPKMSKLAALAKARKEKRESATALNEERASVSLLSRLSQKKGTGSPISPTTPSPKATTTPTETISNEQNYSAQHIDGTSLVIETLPETGSSSPETEEVETGPQITDIDAIIYTKLDPRIFSSELKGTPSAFAHAMFGEMIGRSSKPIINANIFTFSLLESLSKAAQDAFTGPSPDDVVTNAQSQSKSKGIGGGGKASSLEEDIKSVSLEQSQQQAPPPKANINVLKAYQESNPKPNVNFVVVGHVDAGKSTMMGRLLYDCGAVEERTMRKFRKESEQIGKSSFALAWVLDSTEQERSRGVTIDVAVNQFDTDRASFTILDAPGHRDFIPNMIAGASQADVAVLVIDSGTGEFEAGFNANGQTKEHTLLVRSMGVQRIIVAVNKLDAVDWAETRFQEIKQQISQFLTNAGFLAKNITFIPCSGLEGINVAQRARPSQIPWYNGPSLLDTLEGPATSGAVLERTLKAPVRLTVTDVFRSGPQNVLSVSGRIEAGTVQTGERLICMPSSEIAYVKRIIMEEEPRDWAVAGMNVILHLSSIEQHYIRSGDVLCDPENPVLNQRSFSLKLLAFMGLTPMMVDIHKGRLHAAGRIKRISGTLDKMTGAVVKKKPKHIQAGAVASVVVETLGGALPVEKGNKIVLRANGKTIAAGIVE